MVRRSSAQSSHSAFAPSLTGCGLDRASSPPVGRQLRDGRRVTAVVFILERQIHSIERIASAMMRSREQTSRQTRRRTRQRELSDRDSEQLLVLVRILAREAARESFERELSAGRQDQSEVTVK